MKGSLVLIEQVWDVLEEIISLVWEFASEDQYLVVKVIRVHKSILTSPYWSITSKNDTLAGVEAQRMMGFVLKALTEVAQMSQSRIATLAIRVRSFGDLTDENHHPIIGRIQGMI
ncbi:hypothetical protein Tco_0396449 [Tanacetum coccineum]